MNGLLDLPWWGIAGLTLLFTHITIAAVTIYLHRSQAHRAVQLHPLISHFFRLWLWLTTGMRTIEWVATHRKHHAFSDQPGDPHSPRVEGLSTVLWRGAELYRSSANDPAVLARYGHGTPDDWMERTVYRHSIAGIVLMLAVDLALFGPIGLTVWAVQMIWIPFFAAGVINGVAHWWGYRNYECDDGATNIAPWGILIGGEELHNNHHAFPSSARLSSKPWEFDIGWLYIRLFSALGLARVKKLAPRPLVIPGKTSIDVNTVKAVFLNRLHVMSDYFHQVIVPVLRAEQAHAGSALAGWRPRLLKRWLRRDPERIGEREHSTLQNLLTQCRDLKTVYEYRARLQEVWKRTASGHETLRRALQDWCNQAEASGIEALEQFSLRLRGYSLKIAEPTS
ncbi:MAG: DesA family fatty acid desaturase [Gammaproteobacteria bacterium]